MCERNCGTCMYSTCTDANQAMVVAHKFNTDEFTFVNSGEDIVAIPVHELTCENEHNWRPSRGDMLVDRDYCCNYYVRSDDYGQGDY